MYKYLGSILDCATLVGEIKSIEMEEADKYYPAHINIHGTTPAGESFEIYLKVGERSNADS